MTSDQLFFDEYGLIVHADGDGGDCCADTFRYLFARAINGRPDQQLFDRACELLFPIPGIGWRHPKQWNDPCEWSQDQQTPAVAALLEYSELGIFVQIYLRHRDRGWRYQNLDYATPERRNVYVPKTRTVEGDLFLLANSIIRVLNSWIDHNESGRDQNHMVMLIQAQRHAPSRLSNLACWIYRWRYRGPIYALRHYYKIDNPGIAAEFEPAVRKYILGER